MSIARGVPGLALRPTLSPWVPRPCDCHAVFPHRARQAVHLPSRGCSFSVGLIRMSRLAPRNGSQLRLRHTRPIVFGRPPWTGFEWVCATRIRQHSDRRGSLYARLSSAPRRAVLPAGPHPSDAHAPIRLLTWSPSTPHSAFAFDFTSLCMVFCSAFTLQILSC